MQAHSQLLLLSLILPAGAFASELPINGNALGQLNAQNRQALRRMDQQALERRQPTIVHDLNTQQATERRQALNQRRLQAQQQRELGALKHHHKTPASGLPPGFRSRLQQQRFQREQGQQLRRFKAQRRARISAPRR